jgi:hypothetical protein
MSTGSASREDYSTSKELVLVCVCSIVGIMLTAAAIWFGLEMYSSIS